MARRPTAAVAVLAIIGGLLANGCAAPLPPPSSTVGPALQVGFGTCDAWRVARTADAQVVTLLAAERAGRGAEGLAAAKAIETATGPLIRASGTLPASVTNSSIWGALVGMSEGAIALQTAGLQGDPAAARTQALDELVANHASMANVGPVPSDCP